MHPYLTRLGVRSEVQEFIAPFIVAHPSGLLFQQGLYHEHFGLAFHRVNAGDGLWIAGELNTSLVSQVFIGGSVMDLIGFLQFYGHTVPDWDRIMLVATGPNPSKAALSNLGGLLKEKAITLLYPADVLGAIADLKVAAAFRCMPAAAFLAEKEKLQIAFRASVYEFDQQGFSLSKFERLAKFRFNVCSRKPKQGVSFLEQLKAGAFPSL